MRHLPFTEHEGIGVITDRAAERLPDCVIDFATPSAVLGMTDRVLDYAQLAGHVRAVSGWVAAAGVEPGDRVAIVKPNHPDVFVLAAGVSRAGGVPALLSPTMSADHARTVLARLEPKAVFVEQAPAQAWKLGADDPWPLVVLDGTMPGAIRLEDLRGARPPDCRAPAYRELMAITHTSGTTGVPKLVGHSARTISERSRIATLPVPVGSIRRRDRYAACIPWNHARSLDGMIAWLHVGAPLLALSDPDPERVAPLLEAFRPTVVEALANVYVLWEPLATGKGSMFAQTRMFANAFDAIHPRSVRIMLAASRHPFPLWFQAYGQSEVGCATIDVYTRRTLSRPKGRTTLRSMGWAPFGMVRARITDCTSGRRLPAGKVGEIEVRSSSLALGYVGQEELQARQRRGDWWRTGDVGFRTRTGRVFLHDRIVDVVPGVKSCLELEDALLDALLDATEVVVINLEGGAVAVVCSRDDDPLPPGAWDQACQKARVGPIPVAHLPWDDVPRTATLKVRRLALAEDLVASRTIVY